jgi:CMP-N-acetylneuraminic acid synthetase
MFPMNRLEAADIDDIEDFYWAEFLLLRKLKNEEK